MALNNLIATIYRFLHETCTTFGTNTKVQFGCLLSTVLSSTKNQHYFVRNKSTEERRRFTLLALIFVQKTYYFDLPSCVRTNLPSCLAREMAMICGKETDYFKPSCVGRNIAMICGHKTNLPSCVAREMAVICGHTTYSSSCLARDMAITNYCKPSCVPRQRATISGQKTNLPSESKTGMICGLGNLWRCDSRDLIVSSPDNRLERCSVAQFSFGKQNKLICKIGSVCNSGNQINRKFIPDGCTQL